MGSTSHSHGNALRGAKLGAYFARSAPVSGAAWVGLDWTLENREEGHGATPNAGVSACVLWTMLTGLQVAPFHRVLCTAEVAAPLWDSAGRPTKRIPIPLYPALSNPNEKRNEKGVVPKRELSKSRSGSQIFHFSGPRSCSTNPSPPPCGRAACPGTAASTAGLMSTFSFKGIGSKLKNLVVRARRLAT
jgi:hypothetical protein